MEGKRNAAEEMERSDPGNLKLSWVRLKSVILTIIMMMMMMMMMNYACLAGGLHDILSARHTSTVFTIMC